MKRTPVALLAALEALIALAISVGVLVVPATLIWAIGTGFSEFWALFWRTSVDFWLLGHGVHLNVTLSPETVAPFGLPGASAPFVLSLAPIAITALVIWLAFRSGTRSADSGHPITALIAGTVTYALLSCGVVFTSGSELISTDRVTGLIFPPLVFAASMALGLVVARYRAGERIPFDTLPERLGEPRHTMVFAALRAGALASGALIGAAGVLVAILLLVNYPLIIGLYESTELGVGGGVVITLAQLLYLPTLVLWAAAWLIGPGFAVGAGSVFSPLGTIAGPLPAVPVLGILPSSSSPLTWILLIVPLLCGFLAGLWIRRSRVESGELSLGEGAITVAGSAVVSGIILGLLAWFAAGAFGPGRLAEMGPTAWIVGLVFAGEILLGGLAGLVSGRAVTAVENAQTSGFADRIGTR
ncbi:hypothetical protein D9V32_02440 [Mycetocola tolaasinivorans]|uniref:Uncharacterized protein n=1 Tax=Mycetocola tolaasinivorans TaxID=76635 RepID=A0A3L7ABZ7_9MICO|nr:DUF6350 family protein [Mycetocola tolaasinivorans]RLP77330.1 hypothetical protein D9V32_02440 [Mycetocola tolaasinivorans]